MDRNDTVPTVKRALALALMRQALEYLLTIDEGEATGHLGRAVEALLHEKQSGQPAPVI